MNEVSIIERDCKLKVQRFNSIYEIDRMCWDSLIDNIFQSYDFLKSIENANIEESKLYYLMFYSDERITGSAVLSSFNISLDLLAGYSIQKFVKFVRRIYPSFLRVRFLFCGTPVSIGKNNICLKDKSLKDEFIKLLSLEMSHIAGVERSRMQCVKELSDKEAVEYNGFCGQNFLKANTIPYMKIYIRWKDFQSYLNDMRYSYRRQIKEGLKKLGLEEPIIYTQNSVRPDHPYLLLTDVSEVSSEKLHSLYLQVMEKQKNRLEILNKEFFENFFNNMHSDSSIISLVCKDEVLGSGLITQVKNKMTFLLIGFDHSKNKIYDTYFNIVYGIIALAIQRECGILEMGQTSYYFKQRCGADSTDVYMYIKSDNKLISFLLRIFQNILFPKIKLSFHNVFRTDQTLIPELTKLPVHT